MQMNLSDNPISAICHKLLH